MKFESLIFDLDGTLWDTSESCALGFNEGYQRLEISKRVDAGFVKTISGKPADECVEILLDGIPEGKRNETAALLHSLELAHVRDYATRSLFPFVLDGLNELSHKYKLFIVSNCTEEYLEIFLRDTSAGRWITDHECYGRTKRLKGDNIKSVIDRNKLGSACYVGDTQADFTAAQYAKIPFFYAQYGFGTIDEQLQSFESFHGLVRYFLDR